MGEKNRPNTTDDVTRIVLVASVGAVFGYQFAKQGTQYLLNGCWSLL